MLTKALEAFTHPTHTTTKQPGDGGPVTPPRATPSQTSGDPGPSCSGQAFGELLERLDPTRIPTAGGVNATVVITVELDTLLSGLGTAHLDTGQRVSASLVRRLACEAGVIPAVVRRLVDGRSVVLDMGRKRRLHTEHMRIALAIQQGGCTTDGCTRPPAWCHDTAWEHDGHTNVANVRLLCPFHHRNAHSLHYRITHEAGGKIAFHRRT